MSFLEQIKKQKIKLKSQETEVTQLNGQKFLEKRCDEEIKVIKVIVSESSSFSYITNLEPDMQVAEILPFLYLGSQDPAGDPEYLEERNITHVLSIGVVISNHSPLITYKNIKLLDEPQSNLLLILDECNQFINEVRDSNENQKVFVHCNAGYSRSPSVVIAYLMKMNGMTLEKAMSLVKEKRNVGPNSGFINQLKKYETYLKAQ